MNLKKYLKFSNLKVLLENNEKFKQLKNMYDEKSKNENEQKSILRLTVAKN